MRKQEFWSWLTAAALILLLLRAGATVQTSGPLNSQDEPTLGRAAATGTAANEFESRCDSDGGRTLCQNPDIEQRCSTPLRCPI